ncbi:MAG: DoxX family protein [Chitinophagaceae bacterium]
MKQHDFVYLLARLPIAWSMFGHGLVRIPKLSVFSSGMVKAFSQSILSASVVQSFAYALPFLELLTGLFIILGLFTRQSLLVGFLIMMSLIFGSSLIEDWQNVFVQMIYAVYFVLLMLFLSYNRYSVDYVMTRRRYRYR